MRITSNLLSSFQKRAYPEEGDTDIVVPPIIVPVTRVPQPINGLFTSSIATPFAADTFLDSSAILIGQVTIVGAGGNSHFRMAGLEPGLWCLNISLFLSIAFNAGVAANTSVGAAISLDDSTSASIARIGNNSGFSGGLSSGHQAPVDIVLSLQQRAWIYASFGVSNALWTFDGQVGIVLGRLQ